MTRTITTRELRQLLTQIENQEITVRELRAELFEIESQDEPITDQILYNIK